MDTAASLDDYLSLVLSMGFPPETVLYAFFLTLARLLPLFVLAPFLGAKNVPSTIRILFAISLTALFLPQNLVSGQSQPIFTFSYTALLIKELILGFVLGFLATAPFYLAQMSGTLIDHQRGSSSLQVTDPTTQTQTGSLGILYNYILISLFFALNGPFLFFEAIALSYEKIPFNGWLSPSFFSPHIPFWKHSLDLLQTMFTLSVQLGAPALVGVLVTDLFLGIANRLAPQVQIVFLGMPLKSWVALAMLTAGWALVLKVMGKEALLWFQTLIGLVRGL